MDIESGDGINDDVGLEEGPSVGTEDSLMLAEGLADELDKGLVESAGLDEELGTGTDSSVELAEGLSELEERWSRLRRCEPRLTRVLRSGNAARSESDQRQDRHAVRNASRQVGRQPACRADERGR